MSKGIFMGKGISLCSIYGIYERSVYRTEWSLNTGIITIAHAYVQYFPLSHILIIIFKEKIQFGKLECVGLLRTNNDCIRRNILLAGQPGRNVYCIYRIGKCIDVRDHLPECSGNRS